MRRWGILSSAAGLIVLTLFSSASARTWYVKVNGTGDVPTIQAAIEAADHGDTILCAPGTYTWTNQGTGTDHGILYILRGSADMTIKSEAGPEATVLDGQWQGRIMFFQGETELTVDGFTFMRGEAPALGNFVGGAFAAHLSSPVMKNCRFINNTAQDGGAYWYGGQGSPQLIDCLFEGNTAHDGGAIFFINSSLPATVSGCTFLNNSATSHGGAIVTYNLLIGLLERSTFVGNTATTGGAISLLNGHSATLNGCTFSQNEAPNGSGISLAGTTAIVDNSIIVFGVGPAVNVGASSSIDLSCCDLFGNQGGDWTGAIAGLLGINGNFSLDPLFCEPTSAVRGA
jgi:hypothetical protein